jgi:hypothetical protein
MSLALELCVHTRILVGALDADWFADGDTQPDREIMAAAITSLCLICRCPFFLSGFVAVKHFGYFFLRFD